MNDANWQEQAHDAAGATPQCVERIAKKDGAFFVIAPIIALRAVLSTIICKIYTLLSTGFVENRT
ncbi:MAG: hypothetical protein ACR2HE_02710 [Casimicrobiaceae bacterium]